MGLAERLDAVDASDSLSDDSLARPVGIRSIARSLAVLQAVNRNPPTTLADISRSARLPYPTAFRVIRTLIAEGLVERDAKTKAYRPAALVQSLAHGYQLHDRITAVSRPCLVAFTKRTGWTAVISTPVGFNMVVRDSTYYLATSALSELDPEFTCPMLDSAAGRVCLAFVDDRERERLLDAIEACSSPIDDFALKGFRSGALVSDIRAKGYASRIKNSFMAPIRKSSAIAAPILLNGRPVATFGMVIIASAMRISAAEERYASEVVGAANSISEALMNDGVFWRDRTP